MDFGFLTEEVYSAVQKLNVDKLFEIRIRNGFAISVNYDGKRAYLGKNGITLYQTAAIKCENGLIEKIIDNLTERSVYAFNEKIKKGFLTTADGIRVGVAGECVYDEKLVTVKNLQSLNVRIPHEIAGSSDCFFDSIKDGNSFFNTLIVSPPFCGKTTVLKDVARKIDRYYLKNLLIIDERGEFAGVNGVRTDVIKYSDKLYAFDCGIRALSPEIVITDELSGKEDWLCVKKAVSSGVTVISTCHAENVFDVIKKDYFIKGIFGRYVVLKRDNFGVLDGVYDENFNAV